MYSTSDGAEVASFTAKAGINAVVFAGVGESTRLVAGTFGGHIQLWHVAKQQEEATLQFGKPSAVLAMAISPPSWSERSSPGGKAGQLEIRSLRCQ